MTCKHIAGEMAVTTAWTPILSLPKQNCIGQGGLYLNPGELFVLKLSYEWQRFIKGISSYHILRVPETPWGT